MRLILLLVALLAGPVPEDGEVRPGPAPVPLPAAVDGVAVLDLAGAAWVHAPYGWQARAGADDHGAADAIPSDPPDGADGDAAPEGEPPAVPGDGGGAGPASGIDGGPRPLAVEPLDGVPAVSLPIVPVTAGVRWLTTFTTEAPALYRVTLVWCGAPDGLLFEPRLDGQALGPPRDGWRPTPRNLRSDLGTIFLGAGDHLLEFVARESATGALRLGALELVAQG